MRFEMNRLAAPSAFFATILLLAVAGGKDAKHERIARRKALFDFLERDRALLLLRCLASLGFSGPVA